ncbi:MAG: TonB family protein [Verrucomicrobia bacterium]|nr:TonB family protein [Verrucomicrobiota bacterium]
MTEGIGITVKRVAIAHVLVIAAALSMPLWEGCGSAEVEAVPVSLVFEAPRLDTPPRPQPASPVEQAPPAPVPEEIPQAPKPPPRKRTPVEVSKNRVTRDGQMTPPPPPAPTPSKQALKKLLADVSSPAAPAATSASENQRYLALVQRTMYDAWRRPVAQAPVGTTASVSITFGANGSVRSFRLVGTSGIAAMDESVLEAVRSVTQIPGLPASFIKSHPSLTIAFEVLAGAG